MVRRSLTRAPCSQLVLVLGIAASVFAELVWRLLDYSVPAGKYIGNRPCKLRKSTWQERATSGGKTMGPSKKSSGNKHMSKRFKGTMTH